jgi:hypothetical protein
VPEFCRTPAPAAGLLRFLAILALALALARQLPESVPEFWQVQEHARIPGLLQLAMVRTHHIKLCNSSLDAQKREHSNDIEHVSYEIHSGKFYAVLLFGSLWPTFPGP